MKIRQSVHAFVMSFCLGGALLVPGLVATAAQAGEADVVAATATKVSPNSYRFDVSVLHADSGWDHYANAWQVIDPDGKLLGERILAHPHENEQPFTRSQSGVEIPDNVNAVIIRARDLVHGFGGKELVVPLPQEIGQSTRSPN